MAVTLRVLAGPPGDEPSPPSERTDEVDDHLPEIRFGRRAGLEVELPFPALAPIHARLIRRGAGWAVEDLGSGRGTFVDGVALASGLPCAVVAGAVIGIGPLSIVFEGAGPRARAGERPAEGTATIARRLVSDLFGARGGGEVPCLVPAGGWPAERAPPPPLRLAVPDRPYLVGRGEDCDLVLPNDDVSREHAVIVRRWEGVQIRDLGSKNGMRVAGQPITGEHRLRDGDRVEIGSFELRMDDPEDRYLKALEAPEPTDAPSPPPVPVALRSVWVATVVATAVLLAVAAATLLIVLM
jgi:pSer/pThr/pTyr-binding forkhead associated (FHA) protein